MALKPRLFLSKVYRHWLSVAFLFGFIGDLLLLNRIDDVLDNAILAANFTFATVGLLLFYVAVSERLPDRWQLNQRVSRFAPALMQYGFGGLLSGMLIFYGRSGDWVASAPFLLIILAAILGNEFVQKRSNRLLYHLALYFLGTFSYFVLLVPVLTGVMGDWIFIGSGLLALGMVTAVVQLLLRVIPKFMMLHMRSVVFMIGSMYVALNFFYFTNFIPPIPLSLTELTIVHEVSRTQAGSYRLVGEPRAWYTHIPLVQPTVHPSDSVACFAQVYAPTRLSTDIYHRWEYQNDAGEWTDHFRLAYPISGRAENGYRGYTTITSYFSGTWRCSVETERGQVLGRRIFHIDTDAPPRDLVQWID